MIKLWQQWYIYEGILYLLSSLLKLFGTFYDSLYKSYASTTHFISSCQSIISYNFGFVLNFKKTF
jgi:hypothetical protein